LPQLLSPWSARLEGTSIPMFAQQECKHTADSGPNCFTMPILFGTKVKLAAGVALTWSQELIG